MYVGIFYLDPYPASGIYLDLPTDIYLLPVIQSKWNLEHRLVGNIIFSKVEGLHHSAHAKATLKIKPIAEALIYNNKLSTFN